MKRDLLIKNGMVVTNMVAVPADVFIEDGVISSIGRSLSKPSVPVVDAEGCLVLPGVIDGHVQFEVTHGSTSMTDDFDTGTRAAASGGVTTIIDFADQPRGVDALKYLRERKAIADSKVNVDYSLHMSITDLSNNTLGHIGAIVKEESVPSFKLYLAYGRMGRMVNDGEAFAVMREVARHGGIVGVHAESDDLIEYLTKELVQNGQTDPRYFPKSRPDAAEAIGVASAIELARATRCDLYVHHVSTALAIDLIANARRGGVRVLAETCPQYLVLNDEVYDTDDRYLYIMNPPLRASKDRDRLWEALQDGEMDTVGTDHCSYLITQKTKNARFDQVPPGLPGVETLLSVMYTEGVAKGRITVTRLVELLSLNPARAFGLFPQKGSISVGSDGDVVIFDPRCEWTLNAAKLCTNADFCPFEGRRMVGKVEKTILRGEIVYAEGEFCGTPSGGHFVKGRRGDGEEV